ncbi:MAG: beta-lactamase family protein [Chloroflexi bacterium]|nr:beta-lactamase family protein [Chloroflexota bacterium]
MQRATSSLRTAIAVIATTVMFTAGGHPLALHAQSLPAYATTLQTQIPEVMKANAIPGAVVLITSPEQGDWEATFGTSEIGAALPMSTDFSFRIGSNTKTMTSTVILQLVEEGKLRLDDPISRYRPDVPNGEHITIAQLSEMRSGLYSYTFDAGFNATLDADPQKAWTPDELLAIAFTHPANFAPGEKYEYSNTNIVLLGLVIEQLTGMSARDAFQERIFGPLGLRHTSLPASTDSSLPEPHAQGYQFGTNVETIDSYAVPAPQLPAALNGTLKPINNTNANPSWAWTAGGAISTVDDLATYVKALVGGGLLDAKTQQLRLDSIQPIVPGEQSGVGYGLGIARFAPNLYGHDGQIPGFSTLMVYDPTKDNTIIIATNLAASPVDGANAATVLGKAVIPALYGIPVPGGDPAAAAAAAAAGAQPVAPPAQAPVQVPSAR